MSRLITLCLCLSLLISPPLALAQTTLEPGQDPFALSDELLRLFGAEPPTIEQPHNTNSLFNGDDMVNSGLFATPPTQLGGASPLTAPIRTNQDDMGPTMLMLTSAYEPSGDLTSTSVIKLTVTIKNVGTTIARNVIFSARLEDDYATLLPQTDVQTEDTDAPEVPTNPDDQPATTTPSSPASLTPQPPNPPIDEEASNFSDPQVGLVWTRLLGNTPFNIPAGQSETITFYFKANKNDVILRWTLEAKYNSGVSTLLQWIPIKNPNPTGNANGSSGPGVATVCAQNGATEPFPDSATGDQIFAKFKEKWNIEFLNTAYNWADPQFKPYLKGFWEGISSVECTPFIPNVIKDGPLVLEASTVPDYWGYQASANLIQYNLGNMLAQGAASGAPVQFHQFAIHELGHVYMSKNFDIYQQFEDTICGKGSPNAHVSSYGTTNCHEDFAEAIGYYGARTATEQGVGVEFCPNKNPYDWGQATYYNFIKEKVFGNIEMGPPPPTSPTSC